MNVDKALRECSGRHSPVYRKETDMNRVDKLIVIVAFAFFTAWILT